MLLKGGDLFLTCPLYFPETTKTNAPSDFGMTVSNWDWARPVKKGWFALSIIWGLMDMFALIQLNKNWV